MAASSPDLPRGDERQPAATDPGNPPALPSPDPTDNAPTVISKNQPRTLSGDEIANAIRGRKLAHFELLDRIGVGGMAAVLRARDTQLDRVVALKILPPDMATDEENVRRFHQEARSAAKLDHENVARVFFCGEDQRLHFIAFEFVEGDNLRTILERRGRLPVGEALHYMLQIAAGLAHAAQRGVVHRDIKPSNIIITPTGRAKLVDMGLARSLEPQPDDALTQSGVTLGTFDYISPEQALEPRDADVRSDIYSLGCTLYHMITGRPPVPDGTAARKLHHHQHVKPRDPRELVPGLPDEVAVILDRMLAKQPRDRYQTPQQLVHQLLVAARKLGAAGDVQEGVLAMEAVVPNPPRYRPVLLAALTTLAVVVLVLVVGQGKNTPLPNFAAFRETTPAKPAKDREPTWPGGHDTAPADKALNPVAVAPAKTKTAVYDADEPTAAELAKWLKDNAGAEELDVRLARDLDLTLLSHDEAASPRLVFKAPKVTIRSKDPLKPVTVRLIYLPDASGATATRTGFTVDSKDATVEGLCFLIDARGVDDDMIGLLCVGGGSYQARRCQFVQGGAPLQDPKKGLASVVVDATGMPAGRTRLALRECCFLGFDGLTELSAGPGEADQPAVLQLGNAERGGFEAVVRRGPAQIEAVDCAFGPHTADFVLEGKSAADVTVSHCSVLAGRRASVFALADDAAAALKVEYSLFGRVGDGDGEHNGAVLIRQTASAAPLKFEGHENRYYRLDSLLAGFGMSQPKLEPDTSRVVDANPWKEEHPLNRLNKMRFADPSVRATVAGANGERSLFAMRLDQIGAAFQVNFQEHPGDVLTGPQLQRVIGVEQLAGLSFVARLKEQREMATARKERVVDPSLTESKDGVYANLRSAVADAKPGDVILIKHNGDVPINPVTLEDAADLTIRPYPDCHPVLILGAAKDSDAALFRVFDGKLQLEGLEFRLEPKKSDFKAQVVATVIGNGQCSFKGCAVTLDPSAVSAALAVASLSDLGGMMKSDPTPARSQPRLSFENCFIRGQGDLVWDRAGRTFDLEVRNTLAVLDGNFLNLEVNSDLAAPLVTATLANVTAYETGHFLRVNGGKDLKNLPALSCNTKSCLFVAAAGHSLIDLEGPEMNRDQLKDRLLWTAGESGNVYAGFNDMLDQRPHGEEMSPPPIGSDKWKTIMGEMTSKLPTAVKFAAAPAQPPYNRLAPASFKAVELSGYGADVTALPKPAVSSSEMEE